jgi:hypothetical protein
LVFRVGQHFGFSSRSAFARHLENFRSFRVGQHFIYSSRSAFARDLENFRSFRVGQHSIYSSRSAFRLPSLCRPRPVLAAATAMHEDLPVLGEQLFRSIIDRTTAYDPRLKRQRRAAPRTTDSKTCVLVSTQAFSSGRTRQRRQARGR